jgi:hypothetical protein
VVVFTNETDFFFTATEEKKVLHFAPEQEFYNVLRNK